MRAPFPRLIRAEAGTVLVEFAFVLPIMLLLILGGFELSNAIACNRKVTITARAAADLASQYTILSASQIDSFLNASSQIMAPFDASNALVRVSEISTDNNSKATVTWSRAINGLALPVGATYTLPTGLSAPNVSYIVGDTNYAYTPAIGAGFVKPLGLNQTITLLPRASSAISCPTC